ncbi:MAG TPA: hypothetical protein VHO70_10270 [Chitinispirillaceae bacterium]|nr:hypothetical protein [Chitinispirillaceae bacterium]
MKFSYKQGLIWTTVDLFYNGKWIPIENCILDTGSASTAIDIDLIDLNYSKQTKIKRLFGIGTGTQEVISQIVESIKIDSNIIENIEIEFGNFSSKIGINGFIGNDILSKFIVQLDYPACCLNLTPSFLNTF